MFSKLPIDLFCKIIQYLDPPGLSHLALTCRLFHSLVFSSDIFRHLCLYNHFVEPIDMGNNSKLDFKEMFIKKTATKLSVPEHFSGAWMSPTSKYVKNIPSSESSFGRFTHLHLCWLEIGCKVFLSEGHWAIYLRHAPMIKLSLQLIVTIDQRVQPYPLILKKQRPSRNGQVPWTLTHLGTVHVNKTFTQVGVQFLEIVRGNRKKWYLDYIHFCRVSPPN